MPISAGSMAHSSLNYTICQKGLRRNRSTSGPNRPLRTFALALPLSDRAHDALSPSSGFGVHGCEASPGERVDTWSTAP